MRASRVFYALAALFALCVPLLGIYPVFMMKLLCFAMYACAFNLLLGFSGMLSFGHAAFFGSAGYVTGWLVTVHGWGTLPAILAGTSAAAALGVVVGGLALGIIEGFTKVIYPEASNIVVFLIMALVLIVRPAGLFGRE